MNWTELLKNRVADVYHASEGLVKMVAAEDLKWKPTTGNNWMTIGQLLHHLNNACGTCCKGFVTGDWGMPEDMPEDEMLPPAEKMPAVENLAAALAGLQADRQVALDMIAQTGEADLQSKEVAAPWDPTHPKSLGLHFLEMVGHLQSHKDQLYYYLKLMGKPVHTGHLYGMDLDG